VTCEYFRRLSQTIGVKPSVWSVVIVFCSWVPVIEPFEIPLSLVS